MATRPQLPGSSGRSCLLAFAVAAGLLAGHEARAQHLNAALRIAAPDKGSQFGGSLAARNGKIIVGEGFHGVGVVYVHDATSGSILLTIANPTNDVADRFGTAVAWVGDDILVGAPLSDVDGTDQGVAYVFDGTDGSLLHTLTRPDDVAGWFGYSVAGLGDDAVVGSIGPLGPNGEGAYLFDGTTGALLQSFSDPNGGTTSAGRFGRTVITDGSDIFVASTFGASAVYRFDAAGTLLQTYADPEPIDDDEFGSALAVSGTHLAVSVGGKPGDGKVLLYDIATGALEHTYAQPFVSDSFRFGESVGGVPGAVVIGSSFGLFVYETSPPYDLLQQLRAPGVFADDIDGFGLEQAPFPGRGLVVGAIGSAYVFDLCGNGTRIEREQCDDGNVASGDGCSPTCQLETCGAAPAAGCVTATKSQIRIRLENSVYGFQNALKWGWTGPATALALFGDPLTTADLSLCIYDNPGMLNPRLRMQPAILAGGSCATKPCWRTTATKITYGDKDRTPSGIARFKLATGSTTKAVVLGKGLELGLPEPFYMSGQVIVQLRSSTSATCLQAEFAEPPGANDADLYRARTP